MSFKCGIVGLPNVGKSTLFNALTKAAIAAENYPFCTIDPNIGMVPVPDLRLDKITEIIQPKEKIPTSMQFVDIAGLVKGASKGEGLGNQFLAHIRETDAIAHVVRCFENTDIIHVDGKISPANDIAIINAELMLADLDTITKALNRSSKNAKSGNKDAIAEKKLLEQALAHLDQEQSIRTLDIDEKQWSIIRQLHLLSAKPTLYIANVDEKGFENNPFLEQVQKIADEEGAKVIPICAAIEAELCELPDQEKRDFLMELGLSEPGLNRFIRAGYDLLDLQTFFTAGVKEVRAWTIKKGSTAPQAAGRIHTDFEKGFIRAEIIAYDDFVQFNGEQGAKEAGRWRLEGKDYIMQDGDIVHFRFNV